MHTKPTAPTPPTMHLPRAIRTHECTDADKLLQIHAGPSGPGGAPVFYQITMPNIVDDRVLGSASVMLSFQHGPICENGLNGITIESLLAVARDRLEQFQKGPFACRENDSALNSIRIAMDALHHRTRRRQREHAEAAGYERGHPTNDDVTAPAPSPLAGEGRGEGSPGGAGVPGSERSEGPADSPDRLTLRPSVAAFAQEMERTLRKHDDTKGGQPEWRRTDFPTFITLAEEELAEADGAYDDDRRMQAAEEMVDTANYCMMGWDVAMRKATDPDPRADQPAEGGGY